MIEEIVINSKTNSFNQLFVKDDNEYKKIRVNLKECFVPFGLEEYNEKYTTNVREANNSSNNLNTLSKCHNFENQEKILHIVVPSEEKQEATTFNFEKQSLLSVGWGDGQEDMIERTTKAQDKEQENIGCRLSSEQHNRQPKDDSKQSFEGGKSPVGSTLKEINMINKFMNLAGSYFDDGSPLSMEELEECPYFYTTSKQEWDLYLDLFLEQER